MSKIIFLVLVVLTVFTIGCTEIDVKEDKAIENVSIRLISEVDMLEGDLTRYNDMLVFHDDTHMVTCWFYHSVTAGGLSCLPDSMVVNNERNKGG